MKRSHFAVKLLVVALAIIVIAPGVPAKTVINESVPGEIQRRLYENPEGLFVRLNLSLGGGYDSNLFRERYPLADDFDYSDYQPEGETRVYLLNAAPQLTTGYFFPQGLFWKRMMLAATAGGEINALKSSDSDSGYEAENFRRWNAGGEWYLHMGTGGDLDVFARLRYKYSRTQHPDAKSAIENKAPGMSLYNYDYTVQELHYGLGIAGPGLPPVGIEAGRTFKSSPRDVADGDNYDYGPGRISVKIISAIIAGYMKNVGSVSGDRDMNRFNEYRNMLQVDGFILTALGFFDNRVYETWQARDLEGNLVANAPLLEEKRANVRANLYFGRMLMKPIVEVMQLSGLRLGYEYAKNEDNFQGYYDYVIHKGISELNYRSGMIVLSAAYEYRVKKFDERKIAADGDLREDRFHTATGRFEYHFSKKASARIDYSFTRGQSNEDLIYIDYDKHMVYMSAELLWETML